MKFIILFIFLFSSNVFAIGPKTEWSYEGETGPVNWAKLDSSFVKCGKGRRQSPINIEERYTEKAKFKPILFSYRAGQVEIENTGHTIQINLPDSGTARFEGREYKLVNFQFHTPSEEKINSMASHMVAHLVHRSGDVKLAVIAVLFKLGRENVHLKQIFENFPKNVGKKKNIKKFDPIKILPKNRTYFSYIGSLTSPPCTEGVKWFVFKSKVEMSYAQLAKFKKLYKSNSRYVQPTNNRRIQMFIDENRIEKDFKNDKNSKISVK